MRTLHSSPTRRSSDLMNLIEEKRTGTWNRLIFSPISKTQLYLGHLSHYYLVGLGQIILSFFILTSVLGEIGRAHVCTPVTWPARMACSAGKKEEHTSA